MRVFPGPLCVFFLAVLAAEWANAAELSLPRQDLLQHETFWDNRDWSWYLANIPFLDCPDEDLQTTCYYRWELATKHLTYGSPNSGYSFTEFIDRPFWSGAYGAISCPAGHQLYEVRWLRNPRYARDYSRYWLRTPGAQPRNYSTWLADSVWAVHLVHPSEPLVVDLLPDLVANYEAWERTHFVADVGLFWQTGHDDGMEYNINSRQTQDLVRGAPAFRPTLNAYLWADAIAIANIARLAGRDDLARQYDDKARSLRVRLTEKLWDSQREFFFPMYRDDEVRDGYRIRARTLTYQSGQFAGDPHGRELIGYVPWQFNLLGPDPRFDAAWKKLRDPDGFFAEFGPTTVERNDPLFLLQKTCCWWSGQSWPYATTQTLKALANRLQQEAVEPAKQRAEFPLSRSDYLRLLRIYARSHRKQGQPYLAEALHPDSGSFEGHDAYNHSEHYFHSGFCDLIVTGLIGLRPRADDTLELNPLAPADWDHFALTDIPYRGHRIDVAWDRLGTKYGLGKGLHVLVDGRVVGASPDLRRLVIEQAVPWSERQRAAHDPDLAAVNFAVNNDGTYYPRVTASYSAPSTSLGKLNDGNYWYLRHPPNRWTCEGSPNEQDFVVVDFGTPRTIHTVKLYVLDDEGQREAVVRPPLRLELHGWQDGAWQPLPATGAQIMNPPGHRPVEIRFAPIATTKLRVTFVHASPGRSGLTEMEVWGDARLPLEAVPPPRGNLALNTQAGRDPERPSMPRAAASHTSRFDQVDFANDGITSFLPTPHNRWTSYESKQTTDWLEIDFGRAVEFRRVELAIYDDRGGVQAPQSYEVQYWVDDQWRAVARPRRAPEQPIGGQWNEVRFDAVTSRKVRVVFTHQGQARSGVSEIMVWND